MSGCARPVFGKRSAERVGWGKDGSFTCAESRVQSVTGNGTGCDVIRLFLPSKRVEEVPDHLRRGLLDEPGWSGRAVFNRRDH